MKRKIASALFILVCGGLAVAALMHMMGDAVGRADGLSESENRILAHVLAHRFPHHGYNIVVPKTVVAPLWGSDSQSTDARKQRIIAGLSKKGIVANSLVERLYQRNTTAVLLVLKPAPDQGYIVDDGSYEAYFAPNGGGWRKWREAHPQAQGLIRFSRPVYDERSGLFLIYVENSSPTGGAGRVELLKDDRGTITSEGVVELWKK